MSTSVYSTNYNYNFITKSLIYKQLNPPRYIIYKCNSSSYFGTVLSKAVFINFDVQGKGKIRECFLYDTKNIIVKYRHYYYSDEQRKKDMKQNRKKKFGK